MRVCDVFVRVCMRCVILRWGKCGVPVKISLLLCSHANMPAHTEVREIVMLHCDIVTCVVYK